MELFREEKADLGYNSVHDPKAPYADRIDEEVSPKQFLVGLMLIANR